MESKEVYVNVISKSGTTLEPALAFLVLRAQMEKRYATDAKSLFSINAGWILPVAGVDIEQLLLGAKKAAALLKEKA